MRFGAVGRRGATAPAIPAADARFERLRRDRELLRRAAGTFADGVAPGRPRLRLVHPAPRR
jgi:hypothetical protein